MKNSVTVVGAGLAGCEAAWQLAERDISVRLIEMKPEKFSPAHSYGGFAELVCSNSLRSNELTNACGLLKQEMRLLRSLVIAAADAVSVPAGSALAVNRKDFSDFITEKIRSHGNIEVICAEQTDIPAEGIVIVATGPLTSDSMSDAIGQQIGENYLHFFDAAAPIVTAQSIDMETAFFASRYGKGEATDYLNCAMTKERYDCFVSELIKAECAQLKGFENTNVFEGCMPVEVMAARGADTLAFGPLKPVGITNPKTGARPYAVVQLRRENVNGTLYNLVGFQTHLKFGEQKRVFSLIPGLEHAEFVRFGVMHRNTFLNSPKLLKGNYRLKSDDRIYFAGQMTGVEGYVESAASGLVCGIDAALRFTGKTVDFTPRTAIGALAEYVSTSASASFQPMNINFGIIEATDRCFKSKADKNMALAERALEIIRNKLEEINA